MPRRASTSGAVREISSPKCLTEPANWSARPYTAFTTCSCRCRWAQARPRLVPGRRSETRRERSAPCHSPRAGPPPTGPGLPPWCRFLPGSLSLHTPLMSFAHPSSGLTHAGPAEIRLDYARVPGYLRRFPAGDDPPPVHDDDVVHILKQDVQPVLDDQERHPGFLLHAAQMVKNPPG